VGGRVDGLDAEIDGFAVASDGIDGVTALEATLAEGKAGPVSLTEGNGV